MDALVIGAVKGEIEAALKRNASEDAWKITGEVHGADVTLRATVPSWAERERATMSAWGTPGVRSLQDEMT